MSHYNKKVFVDALKTAGFKSGDIIFGHSNIGYFGFPEEGKDPKIIFEVIFDAIFDVIGKDGTLVVPTFTYSFQKNEVFDINHSPGIGGFFSEMIRNLSEAKRSCDPAISVAAIGAHATELTKSMPENSYGENCIFERLLKYNAKVCNMNFDAATTFVHYAERELKVPYRFDKNFKGVIKTEKNEYAANNTIFVRYLDEQTEPAFETFDVLAKAKNLCQQVNIGRGFIKVMSIKDQFKLIAETLVSQPWFLVKAGISGHIPDLSALPS